MSSITTFSGQDFDPINIDHGKILIEDIAHALSLLCRGNGHLKHFYSVAQHSVNCCIEAQARGYSAKVQLICLLHDASEAYLGDVTRPLKTHLAKYLEIEESLQNAIYQKFVGEGIAPDELAKFKQIDDDMLSFEFNRLMNGKAKREQPRIYGELNLDFEEFDLTKQKFLEKFKLLV